MRWLSKNFHEDELKCPCCNQGGDKMDPALIDLLQQVRDHFDLPVHITSGYRCETRNRVVGGAKHSQHLKGKAADFTVDGVAPVEVQWYLRDHMGGLGKAKTFTHADVRGYRARWKY
jgi:uncharacterized protein YcbK (DUF882 family)